MIQKQIPQNHKFYFHQFSKKNIDFTRRLKIYKDYCEPFGSKIRNFAPTQIIGILPQDSPKLKKVFDSIKNASLVKATSPLDHKSIWIEIFPKDINKGHTFLWLCKHLNINYKNSIGVGNDYNDVDFLDLVSFPFVVENSPEDLKQKYPTTKHCDENGLTKAIKNFRTLLL